MEFNVQEYINLLQKEFKANGDPTIAREQKEYLKDRFECYGIKVPLRREIQKPFLDKSHLPSKKEAKKVVYQLTALPQRELHMFAQELWAKFSKKPEKEDMEVLEYLITTNSWWDSVDFIAVHLVGAYFKKFPELRSTYSNKWIQSENLWLQRTAILFQLKYKKETDLVLLEKTIKSMLGSKEFFINKAIGWMLRDYSRIDALWVEDFVEANPELSNLSKREALRLLKG